MGAPISQLDWEKQRREAMDAMDGVVDQVGLPKVLLPYQARTVSLLDSVRDCSALFVEKSRRIGLTWALAAYAVLRAARQRPAGGMDVMYISYSREMTREFIDAAAMWARAFNIGMSETEELLFDQGDDDGDKAIQTFRIRFASGFELLALSSAPRGLRGKQGVVIIDEAAFVDNLAQLIKAAMAFLMWGGQVVVCSTHDGVDNPFNQNIQDILAERAPYKHLRVDFDEALRDGLFQRICLVNGEQWTPEFEGEWREKIIAFYGDGADEELFCVPSASSGSWLPGPLIEARMTAVAPIIRLELPDDYLHKSKLEQDQLMAPTLQALEEALGGLDLDLQYAGGFDFGRVSDLSTFSLLAIEKQLRRREALSIEMRNVPGDEQKLVIGMVLEHVRHRLVGAAFDATGMGWTVAEDMGRRFGLREDPEGAGAVMAIKFTEEWYRLHTPPLKVAFEDDMIAIAPDDEHLSDIRLVKLVRGVPRVPDVRTGEAGKRRHGDYFIALLLAHYASRMRWVEYGYRAAERFSGQTRTARMVDRPRHDADARVHRDWWDSPLGAGLRGGL